MSKAKLQGSGWSSFVARMVGHKTTILSMGRDDAHMFAWRARGRPGARRPVSRVEVGELTLYGKQCSLFMVLPNAGVRDLLLRVYVRPSGPPMMLELFNYSRPVGLNGNHQPLCSSIDELEATILAFLATEDVKQGLLELKDVAA